MLREGRQDEALALIREQAAKHPEWPPPPLILARMLLRDGQALPGRRALEQAAVEAPEHPEVYLTFGKLDLADGHLSDAQLNYENAQALLGSGQWDAERVRAFRREALAGLDAVAETRADWKTAREHLNAWLELEPKNGPVRQRLGGVLFRPRQTRGRVRRVQAGGQGHAVAGAGRDHHGPVVHQRGDITKAQEWFDYAPRARAGQRPGPHRPRGLAPRSRTCAKDASKEADEALKLDPKSTECARLKGFIAWHLRDLAGAETLIEPLHRDTPDDAGSANLLALVLVEQDDPEKRARGLKLAEVNARQNPRSHEVQATLGWAQYRSGHLDKAEPTLRAAVQGFRMSPDIAYFLARVLADKGHKDDAVKILKSATNCPAPSPIATTP